MLDADALLWGGDAHLTLSFAPDGTEIAGLSSSLFSTFNAVAPTDQWQEAILRAFQTWASQTNGGVGVVADSGAEFGSAGSSRGDARFGDIRIGSAPLATGAFAIAVPASDVLSGTWVGDVIFNSNASLDTLDEVFAVALHEAGHIFGLEHNPDPLSPMHVHGITPVTSLTPFDISSLQQLHGSPQPDVNEVDKPNDSIADATHLDLNHVDSLPEGSAPSVVYGGVSSTTDRDFYRFQAPDDYTGALSVVLRTKGISLLAPSLSILDTNGDLVETLTSGRIDGDMLTVTLPAMSSDSHWYFVVESGRSDLFGVGDYSLVTVLSDRNVVDQATIDRAADGSLRFLPPDEIARLFRPDSADDDDPEFFDDEHTDDDVSSGIVLDPTPGFAMGTRYEAVGSIADSADADFYVVTSPDLVDSVMTIRIRSLEASGLTPRVNAFDEDQNPLPLTILVNGAGEYVVQITGVEAESEVTLSVQAAEPNGVFNHGNYQLTVGFGEDAVTLTQVAAGTLTAAQPAAERILYVALPQLFHFALAVPVTTAAANAAVITTIFDENNQVVFRVAARPGETRTAGSVLLKPGVYQVQVVAVTLDGALTSELSYSLLASVSSDPFVANPDDPTFQPEFQCDEPGNEGLYCYPGEFISPDPFLWDQFINSLPEPPTAPTLQQLIQDLLGDWWRFVWNQAGANGPPLAQNDVVRVAPNVAPSGGFTMAASVPPNVLTNDIDPERGSVVALLKSTTSHGTLTLNTDGSFAYIPRQGFVGVDTFTYTAFDFVTESAIASVRISVGLRGDYDQDADVDGADFLEWQRTFGNAVSPFGIGADGDGNGSTDAADVIAWQDNFGASEAVINMVQGDYDGDGIADGADFLVWQRAFGDVATSAGSGADGDLSGIVDAGDLEVWKGSLSRPPLAATDSTPLSIVAPSNPLIASLLAGEALASLAGLSLSTTSASTSQLRSEVTPTWQTTCEIISTARKSSDTSLATALPSNYRQLLRVLRETSGAVFCEREHCSAADGVFTQLGKVNLGEWQRLR